jgi:hypothetical protein
MLKRAYYSFIQIRQTTKDVIEKISSLSTMVVHFLFLSPPLVHRMSKKNRRVSGRRSSKKSSTMIYNVVLTAVIHYPSSSSSLLPLKKKPLVFAIALKQQVGEVRNSVPFFFLKSQISSVNYKNKYKNLSLSLFRVV